MQSMSALSGLENNVGSFGNAFHGRQLTVSLHLECSADDLAGDAGNTSPLTMIEGIRASRFSLSTPAYAPCCSLIFVLAS